MKDSIFQNAQFYLAHGGTTGAAGTTSLQGTPVDTIGYDSVCYLVYLMTAASTGGINRIYHSHGSSSESTSMVSCTGASYIAQSTAATPDSILILDIPGGSKERYCAPYIFLDSTNATIPHAFTVLYNSANVPTTQPSDVLTGSTVVSTPST